MSISTNTSTSSPWKKTILRLGIGFFIAMLLLTFFSGTLNNLALAKVSVVSPSSAALQKVITADGSFAAKRIVNVMLGTAGKVSEVKVAAGDVVKAGDTLVKMDMTDLMSQIQTEKDNLTKMQNSRAKQLLTVAPDYTAQNIKIANDKKALADAKAKLALLKAQVDPPATVDELAKAQLDVTNAQNNYTIDANALSRQKKQDSNSKKGSALDLKNTDIGIKAQQDKIAGLEKQLADNSEIKASVDGRIQTVNAVAGNQANTSQPLMTILDTAAGLEFSVDVSNGNADLIGVGGQLDIHLQGSTDSVTAVIREKKNSTANPGQAVTVWMDADTQGVLDNNVQPNQKGDIRYSVNTASYNMTLPNGAVREDSAGNFVLVVQQQRTPLGNSLVLSRVDVTVLDSDSYRSAVSGALNQRDQVVGNSDKAVSDGDTVRMAS